MSLPGSKILEIIISLVLIYALLSLLVSVLLEGWNHARKTRPLQLKASIFQLLNDSMNLQFGELFYNHFLIDGLRNKATKNGMPHYISSSMFAEVLIDIVANRFLDSNKIVQAQTTDFGKQYVLTASPMRGTPMARFKMGLDQLNASPFTDTLHALYAKSGGKHDEFKKILASWYDDYMDRTTGWYKAQQRNKLYVFGFLVAIALNVDTLHLVKMISLDDTLRRDLVQTADQVADQYNMLSDSSKQKTEELERIFKTDFSVKKIRDSNGDFEVDSIRDAFVKKVSANGDTTFRRGVALLDSLKLADSTWSEYKNRVTRILNISTSLNIPIGWDESSAPLSWWNSKLTKHPCQIQNVNRYRLFDYFNKRNEPSAKNVISYIIGIFITSISLSFGAPFWFEVLVKLVNIRRAGKKPDATNINK